jgi:hypothetical protein
MWALFELRPTQLLKSAWWLLVNQNGLSVISVSDWGQECYKAGRVSISMQGLKNSSAYNGNTYLTLFFFERGSLVLQGQQISSVVALWNLVSIIRFFKILYSKCSWTNLCLEVYLHAPYTPYCRDSQLLDINNNTTTKLTFKGPVLLLRIWEVLAALLFFFFFFAKRTFCGLPSYCRQCRDSIAIYTG